MRSAIRLGATLSRPVHAALRQRPVRQLTTASGGNAEKKSAPPPPPKNAFRDMPGSSASLPGLVFLLGLVFAYNAYRDYTEVPEEPEETSEERVARQLKVLPDEIQRVLPDGRVLLVDGSIRTLKT